jgi:DNA-binding GntR family transcriptional regulator
MPTNTHLATTAPITSIGAAHIESGTRLSDQAYDRLREMIVNLELAPGAVLNERELMSQLNSGRTPLREAIQRLVIDKLAVVFPRHGAFVTNISIGDLSSITDVRIALDGYCANLAAMRRTETDVQKLLELLQATHGAEELSYDAIGHIDENLHLAVAEVAANDHLVGLVMRYYALTRRMWNLARSRPLAKDYLMGAQWDSIVDAIRLGDSAAAEKAMREHVRLSRVHLHHVM